MTKTIIRGCSDVTSDTSLALIVCTCLVLISAIAGLADPLPLAAGLALVTSFTLAAALSPTGGVLAVVVTLPYFYKPLVLGSQSFAASELLLAGALAGGVIHAAYRIGTGQLTLDGAKTHSMVILRSRMFIVLAVLLVAGAAALVFAREDAAMGAGLREYRWTLLQPFLLVIVLSSTFESRSRRILLIAALIAAGGLAALHGLLDVVTGGGVIGDNVRRLSGPLPHPNALALFLLRPFALSAALAVLMPGWRRYTIPATGLTGLVIFGTFSRGAMIAIAALAFLLLFMTNRKTRLIMAGSVATMAVAALALAGDRMRSALEGGSVSLRLDIWTSAARMIRDSPLFGYGPDQFLYAYAPRYILPTAWDERFTSHAHNLILDAWIRLGLAGAIVACTVLLIVTRLTVRRMRIRTTDLPVQTAALVALMAVMVHGLIDNAYFGHDLAMSAWVLAWLAFTRQHDETVGAQS